MDSISVRDVKADGNARIHVGNSSVTHVHNYAEAQEHHELSPAPFSLIPFSRDPDFVGRGDILDQIAAHCGQAAGRAALVGLGGVGKSQLAIEYSHQRAEKEKGAWVFWVHAGTRARVEEGLRAIADAVKLPDRHKPKANIPQLLYAWLSNERNGKWFMILDSADDQDVFYGGERGGQPLASYLPQSPNGSILVTTRDQAFAIRLTGSYKSVIKVGPMNSEQALLFLEKKLGTLSEPDLGAELVSALDRIPLAINQAASYIQARAPRSTIKKYLAEFRQSEGKSAKLLAHDAAELRRDGSSSNAIMKTWQISFDHIRSKQPSAADLLALMSFFDNQSIPESALNPEDEYDSDCESDLESNWASEELANHASMRHIMDAKRRREDTGSDSEIDSASEADVGFEDDVALLRDYCLISASGDGTQFEMHRLVQLATKKWLKVSEKHEEFRQLFIHRLAVSLPETTPANELLFRDIYSHSQIAIGYRPNKTNLRPWFYICYAVAWYQGHMLAQYAVARALLEKAINIWQARKGPTELCVLIGNALLAGLMQGMGEFKEAEALITAVLETFKTAYPADSRRTLSTMIELADMYLEQEKYKEAEELQLYVISRNSATGGPEDDHTLSCRSALARTYFYQGRLEEAEAIELETLDMSKRILGTDHYETLLRMSDLAVTYSEQNRLEEAATLELQALNLRSAPQNVEDRGSLKMRVRLAQTYNSLLLCDESMRLERELLHKLIAQFGPSNAETLDSMERLAGGLKLHGFYEEAEDLYLRILDICKSASSKEYSRSISNAQKLAILYNMNCQNGKAERLLSDLLARVTAEQGPDHYQTLDAMLSLAHIYESMHQAEKAHGLYCRVMVKCKSYHDTRFLSQQLNCWNKLAMAEFDDVAKYQELELMLENVVKINLDIHGPDDGNTISTLRYLAKTKVSLGKLDEAATIHSEIFQSCKARYGGDHLKTLSYMTHLVQIRIKQGRLVEAKELQSEALGAFKAKLGVQNQKTLMAMGDLGDILMELGDYKEAEKIAREILHEEQSLFGKRNWHTVATAEMLYRSVLKQVALDEGRRIEAVQLFEEYFELRRRQHGEDSIEVAGYLMMGAYRFTEMDMAHEACSRAAAAHDIYKRIAGPEDPETLANMGLVAAVWDENGRYRKSMALLRECVAMHRQVLGEQHPQTDEVVQRYARWVRELEEHVEEHAGEKDHPYDTCEACLASKIAREHALQAA